MGSIKIKLCLNRLVCHKHGIGLRKKTPFLWTVFFKVDGTSIKVTDTFHLKGKSELKFSRGSHGNLGIKNIGSIADIKIPVAVGEWKTTLTSMRLPIFEFDFPGIIGVLSVLLLQGNVTDNGMETGHSKLNSLAQKAINESINQFHPHKVNVLQAEKSVKEYFEHRVQQNTKEIISSVTMAVRKSQTILQNFWSLTSRDDLVGYQAWDFNMAEIDRNKGNIKFSQKWNSTKLGDWELFGNVEKIKTKGTKSPNKSSEV